MKTIKLSISVFCFQFLFLTALFSQTTTTVNYSSSGLSTSNCNVFALNPNVNGLQHSYLFGGVIFNGTNLFLTTDPFAGEGTAYSIRYFFKTNYTYSVAVMAALNTVTNLLVYVHTQQTAHPGSSCLTSPYVSSIAVGTNIGNSFGATTGLFRKYSLPDFTPSVPMQSLEIGALGGNINLSGISVASVIIVETPPASCSLPAPTGLSVSSLSNDYAVITWDAVPNAVSYTFEYKMTSSSTWINGNSGNPTYTQTTLSFLNNGTTYDMRVKVNCATGSGPYATSQFSTSCFLAQVTNLNGSPVSGNSSNITWTYPANANAPTTPVSFNLEYKDVNSPTWNVINVPNSNPSPDPANIPTNLSYQLTGLSSTILYDLRVRANCQTGSGNYVTTQFPTFTCDMPTGLVTEALNNFATFQWDRMPLASSYDVQVDYDALGSHNWVTVASGINPPGPVPPGYTIYGLNASTTYAWRVRALCANSQYSNYTVPVNFTTLPNCNAVISNISTAVITDHSAILSWDNSNPNAISRIDYKIISATNWTCFNNCLNNTSPVVVNGLSPSTTYIIRVMPFCSYTAGGPYGEGTPQQVQITTQSNFTGPNIFSNKNQNVNNAQSISAKTENNKLTGTKKDKQKTIDFTTYPSPVNNQLMVTFDLPVATKITIQLINPSGITVYSKIVNSHEVVSLDVANYSNGLYLLKVNDGISSKLKKIIIQH